MDERDTRTGGPAGGSYGYEGAGDDFGGQGFGRSRGGFQSGGPSRLLDDLARLATDAAGVAQGARREVETAFRAQAERFVAGMDLVSREEFEVVRDMAVKARAENEALNARLDAMEAAATTASAERAAPKPKPKKAANPGG